MWFFLPFNLLNNFSHRTFRYAGAKAVKMKVSSHKNNFEFFRLSPFPGEYFGDWYSTERGCYAGKKRE